MVVLTVGGWLGLSYIMQGKIDVEVSRHHQEVRHPLFLTFSLPTAAIPARCRTQSDKRWTCVPL